MNDYTDPANLLELVRSQRRTSTPQPLTETQAMGALDHMTPTWTLTWTLTSMAGQVFVSATGRWGPLSCAGRTRKDALNAAVHALRNERIDHADADRRTA